MNFHNLHTGYFNYLAIPRLTKDKPAVFTLHDMWSFNGHCAYSYDCSKWKSGCGNCPYPDTYPEIQRDNTALAWKLKDWTYKYSNLTIVAPSRWLEEQARESILSRFNIHRIPYGLNTANFSPVERDKSHYELEIDNRKKVLMFAAENVKSKRKGIDLLLAALKDLPANSRGRIFPGSTDREICPAI